MTADAIEHDTRGTGLARMLRLAAWPVLALLAAAAADGVRWLSRRSDAAVRDPSQWHLHGAGIPGQGLSRGRDGGDFAIAIGKAPSEGFMRLMEALFCARPGCRHGRRARQMAGCAAWLERVLEGFEFVTPAIPVPTCSP